MTRRRRGRTEQEQVEVEEDEAVVGCLDVLRGASALLARHKAEVAGLLSRRGGRDVESLERLASDLTEVLSTASSSSGGSSSRQQGEQREEEQQEGAVCDAAAAARRGGGGGGGMAAGGAKRAKAQQAVQVGGRRQQGLSASSSSAAAPCEGRDALSIPEVLEHVMSFAKDKELLGRLSRVCRLWRRVSECERLSRRVLELQMPSALLGGEESLHARLGGSARRCLLVVNATMASGRLMCRTEQLLTCQELVLLAEVFTSDKLIARWRGALSSARYDDDDIGMELCMVESAVVYDAKPFSPASMDVDTVQGIFTGEHLAVSFYVMDMTTGVTASLYNAWIDDQDDAPVPQADSARLNYNIGPVPVTSMTYAGPPLQARVGFELRPSEPFEEDEINTLHEQRDRSWTFGPKLYLALRGQPSIYGERFVRTRLAEEAMAAKQHGSR